MEGERRRRTTRKRTPLTDRTNTTPSSLPKLPPSITNAATTSKPVEPRSNENNPKHPNETQKKRRRKLTDPTSAHNANKENIATTDSPPSTPYIPPPLDEPVTVYARRKTAKKKGMEKVVNEAFTCLPVDRKWNESSKSSVGKVFKCLTNLPKKPRRDIREHVVSKDYIEQQRAYFAEIDNCELPEEEVSDSELSDR